MVARAQSANSSARGTVLDAAMVVLLVAGTLSILDDTYADRSYLVAGLVPVVLLLGLTLFARRFRDGVWWYALGAVLLFAPVGALVALRRPGPYVMPTFETMNRVLGECITAPTTLVSTVPPVDAAGQVMLVPFMLGFLAGAPAAWLALATRRTLAPIVPLFVALGLTIPLGVLVPTLLLSRGVALAVVTLVWAAARARRGEPLAGQARGTVASTAVAAVLVTLIAGLVSVVVPDDNEVDRVLLQSGDDRAVLDNAVRSVVPLPVGRHIELLKATGVPPGRRLRFASLDLYDGTAWGPAEESPGADRSGTFKRIGRQVRPLNSGPAIEVRVKIRPGYSSAWLPLLGELTSLELDYTDGRSQLRDVRYNQATSSALIVGGVNTRDNYTFESVLTKDGFTLDDATQIATEEQRQIEGAFLDTYLKPFDREELLPIERVLLFARYLQVNGATRLTGSSSQAPVDLGLRMLGSRDMIGTPFQYAALMALGASRLGVPARVVTGAEPDDKGVVEYTDVTEWVELQFADGTWRTLDQTRYTGTRPFTDRRDREAADAFVAAAMEQAALGKDRELRIPKGAKVELGPDSVIEFPLSTEQKVRRVVAVLLGVLLLVLVPVPSAKLLRRARRRRTSSWSAVYVNGWQEVIDAARDRGTPIPDAWSRVSQAKKLGMGLELARRADTAVFAPHPSEAEDGQDYWDACQELRGKVASEAEGLRRWLAPLNPESLLAGLQRRRSSSS